MYHCSEESFKCNQDNPVLNVFFYTNNNQTKKVPGRELIFNWEQILKENSKTQNKTRAKR